MKFKDYVMLMGASLALGFILSWTIPNPIAEPTPQPKVDTIVTTNVKGKTALFIGDSHTANHSNGWQIQLSKLVGFKMINASVGGKMTYWMLQQAKVHLVKKYDYCFIYGGANDMYSVGIKPQTAVDNIKSIARICKEKGIICVVLTGFDAKTCTKSNNLEYPGRYTEFQKLLMSQDMEGATVVDTRVVDRKDCWDGLCHMAPSGHKKIAEKIVKDLALQRI